jgi:hypothetical protein
MDFSQFQESFIVLRLFLVSLIDKQLELAYSWGLLMFHLSVKLYNLLHNCTELLFTGLSNGIIFEMSLGPTEQFSAFP